MTELPMDCWAQRREICLTLEEGPGGLSPIDSFIVLLSAREVVTPRQLRQTLVYKFVPAISWLQNKTNDTAKGGNSLFQTLSKVTANICSCSAENLSLRGLGSAGSPVHFLIHLSGLCQPGLSLGLHLGAPCAPTASCTYLPASWVMGISGGSEQGFSQSGLLP